MTNWHNQFMGTWWNEPDPLEALALEYLKNTEDHDWRVCRHFKGNMAMPVSREEIADCTLFARGEYQRLVTEANNRQLQGSLWKAIKRAERHFTETYAPPSSRGPGAEPTFGLDLLPHSRDT